MTARSRESPLGGEDRELLADALAIIAARICELKVMAYGLSGLSVGTAVEREATAFCMRMHETADWISHLHAGAASRVKADASQIARELH